MIDAAELAAAQGAYTFIAGALITLLVGGVVAARKLSGSSAPWAWGGVAFVLSQAARLPVLTLVSALLIGSAAPEVGSASWILSVVVASFTAGLFEEASRALILSTAARRLRNESEGIAFGFGHAGIEALIFTLLPSLAAIALLGGAADGSIYSNLPPGSSESLDTAVAFLSGQSFAVAALAGCTDLKPLQAQVDTLKSQVSSLQSQVAAAKSAADGAGSAAASAASAASGAQSTANQALAAAQASQSCCDATNEKIDRMFKRTISK